MTRTALGAVAAATAIGVIAGAALHPQLQIVPARPDPAAPGASTPLPADLATIAAAIDALNAALDEERGLRGALELELAYLRQMLALDDNTADPPKSSPDAPAETAAAPASRDPKPKDWFDEAALRERGVDERRSAWLRERFEALQMEELYLRDQAVRERWLNKPRYQNQLQLLRNTARDSLGIADYDWLLYASGRNNRVLINDVLQNSPAAAAGLMPGDLILRYDDVAMLSPLDLTSATNQGDLGSTAAVDVERNGEVQRLYINRGPLGARISWVQRAPLPER